MRSMICRSGMASVCERADGFGNTGERLVSEQHCHGAIGFPVHSAIELQPVEQRGHAQSRCGRLSIRTSPAPLSPGEPTQWFNPAAFLGRRRTTLPMRVSMENLGKRYV